MKELVGDECFNKLDEKGYILFYFGASWFKPCQEILPLMEDLKSQYDPNLIQFYKIDIDPPENKLICEKCKIKVVPSFLLFKERQFINRMKGNNIQGVTQMINNEMYTSHVEEEEEEEVEEVEEDKPKPIPIKKDPFLVNKSIFNKERLFQ